MVSRISLGICLFCGLVCFSTESILAIADEPSVQNATLRVKYDPSISQLPVSKQLENVLSQPSNLKFKDLPLAELVRLLRENAGLPLFLDRVSFKNFDLDPMVKLEVDIPGSSLKGILFAALNPHGMKAVIENDLVFITVDHDAFGKMGGKTTQWISINDESAEATIDKLGQVYAANFLQIPLEDALRQISQEQNLAMVVNTRALEDIGLTRDVPVTLNAANVTTYAFLNLMLRENDLVVSLNDNLLVVTTDEDANSEDNMLVRAYWLDGTGVREPEMLLQLIQSTINPASWEALGGPATLRTFGTKEGRIAIVASTTLADHLQIENLLNSLRGLPNRPARVESLNRPTRAAAPASEPPAGPTPSDDPFGRGSRDAAADPFGGTGNSDDPFGF